MDSVKFIFGLFILSIIGYLIDLPWFIETFLPEDFVLKFLDLITIAVPPTLPLAL
jgi:hypothetical protein